jgi:hypothetical protein
MPTTLGADPAAVDVRLPLSERGAAAHGIGCSLSPEPDSSWSAQHAAEPGSGTRPVRDY